MKASKYLSSSQWNHTLSALSFLQKEGFSGDWTIIHAGKIAIAETHAFLTQREFADAFNYRMSRHGIQLTTKSLSRLTQYGIFPQGGFIPSSIKLQPLQQCIQKSIESKNSSTLLLLCQRYEQLMSLSSNGKLFHPNAFTAIGIGSKRIDADYMHKYRGRNFSPLYLYSQIPSVESLYIQLGDRAIQGAESFKKKSERLRSLIYAPEATEKALQQFLKESAWIWGIDATKVYPKKALANKYEVDFLIQRADGSWEIVEIESPRARVLTRNLRPTKELTHAMSQVRDYQEFCLKNYSFLYQNENIELLSPKGVVIIGRGLNKKESQALESLNRTSHIKVATYDYLLTTTERLTQKLTISRFHNLPRLFCA
jgi:hypothetical protein